MILAACSLAVRTWDAGEIERRSRGDRGEIAEKSGEQEKTEEQAKSYRKWIRVQDRGWIGVNRGGEQGG